MIAVLIAIGIGILLGIYIGEWYLYERWILMVFNHNKEFIYWNQTYLFRFYDKKSASVFCDLCNLYIKYNPIRKWKGEKQW